jgi:hypothetical protein
MMIGPTNNQRPNCIFEGYRRDLEASKATHVLLKLMIKAVGLWGAI